MQLDVSNIYENVKVELTNNYVQKIIDEYIKMSKECDKYIPFNIDRFDLGDAFYTYLKLDPSNNGPDVSLEKEKLNRKIIEEAINNRSLVPTIKNGIKMNPITATQLGWNTYQSWHLINDKGYNKDDINYRFYINANSEVLPQMIQKIYSYYRELDCPFYFKSAFSSRGVKDNIVIYSSKEQIENTLKVIKKLEINDKNLIAKCGSPHLFTASIDNFVGFATESKKSNNSYTKIISKIITDELDNSVNTWINDHRNLTVGNNKVPIKDYLDKKLYNSTSIKYTERKNGYSEYIKRLGNLLEQITKINSNFRDTILKNIKNGLVNNGFNADNICFDNIVLEELKANSSIDKENHNNNLGTLLYPQYDFSFNGLRNTYNKYDLYKEENGDYYIKDKELGMKITDPLIISKVSFSKIWSNIADGDSFDNNNKEIYEDIICAALRQDNVNINLEELRNNLGNPKSQYIVDKIESSPKYMTSFNKLIKNINITNNKNLSVTNGKGK